MGNTYLPHRFLHAHRSPVTYTNVTDVTVRPVTDNTKKLIKNVEDFTSSSLYRQTHRHKRSHIFFVTNKHAKTSFAWAAILVVPKDSLRTASSITKTRLFKCTEKCQGQNWKFSDKNSDVFHISAQNIDCGYSLEPPRRDGSNEYPRSIFSAEIRKIMYTPVNPSFTA